MSQGSGDGRGGGMDFNLAEEVLAVIPTDPYEQLDLARKITSMAIASRVSKMEGEIGRMRTSMFEKDRIIYELQDKLLRLHQENQETESRLKIALQENINLSNERDSLAMTAKKLSRDLSKLEAFKRQLMQSLTDDHASAAETVDIGTCDQSIPKAYPDQDDGINDYTSLRSSNGSMDMGSAIDEGHGGERFAITPYVSPRLTPEAPKVMSVSGSSRGYSAAGSPQRTGADSPTKPHYGGTSPLWYLSSQQSSASSTPPRRHSLPARSPRIDGKEFFRQARSQLSYEQFSAFLANIKELNAQKQTREETLRKAEEIFGAENKDLFISFQGLLNRSIR
ncbi:Tetratricopeptide repeat-like superfamily protein isoform 1 [Hibiscus syriacus]|uniref:Tetratricopeptide repeat-like superfamily protein isoform 1 n=1 Tax=Hibiscus syriacus TaxID=106335 RepID=A0A6A2YLU4_HIBSY|nr:Tetratricopeptide repeat-like superfamily protein isoform 1 [Hibiscus syriacus]